MAREIVLHEPLFANVVIRNDGDSPIEVDLGWDQIGAFEFSVASPTGEMASHRAAVRDGMSRSSVAEIAAAGTLSHRMVVSEIVELPSPGPYRLQIRFAGEMRRGNYGSAFHLGEGVRPWAKVWQADIVVHHRDPEKLQARCAELLASAMDRRNVERRTSARALASVRDRIAIPFLVTLTESDFQSFLVTAIGRIGGEDAVAALARLSESPDRAVAANASQELQRLNLGLPRSPGF